MMAKSRFLQYFKSFTIVSIVVDMIVAVIIDCTYGKVVASILNDTNMLPLEREEIYCT